MSSVTPRHEGELLHLFSSGQTLIARGQGLVLLCKEHYVDVVGSDAMVGGVADYSCQKIFLLGSIHFAHSQSSEERRAAFEERIAWINDLSELACEVVPLQRAQKCLTKLIQAAGAKAIADLSDEWLCQVCGVLPNTMTMARKGMGLPASPAMSDVNIAQDRLLAQSL
ncbi:hypothetical protein [Leptolyngbya sp. FACHB-261]|uniref:hypothetical protein n=1 Tax=Leptolyngbya sp. FACHB-261 TaxID=2692806 RepID=UPI0016836CED|nr:hypothetical protein [Leptolyngbya sp. FACHB-261]MBD2103564.1 hypothetical protein [Leptolyngbya sp. FACHB-261]